VARHALAAMLAVVETRVMPEELYPSDHRMVIVDLQPAPSSSP
jgi:hypothetical protein